MLMPFGPLLIQQWHQFDREPDRHAPPISRVPGHFPNDQTTMKLIWLALHYITANWKNPPASSHAAQAHLAIEFGERFVFSG